MTTAIVLVCLGYSFLLLKIFKLQKELKFYKLDSCPVKHKLLHLIRTKAIEIINSQDNFTFTIKSNEQLNDVPSRTVMWDGQFLYYYERKNNLFGMYNCKTNSKLIQSCGFGKDLTIILDSDYVEQLIELLKSEQSIGSKLSRYWNKNKIDVVSDLDDELGDDLDEKKHKWLH